MTADDMYSLPNSENLPQPIQMQLSKKLSVFSQVFSVFLKTASYFEHVQKNMTVIGFVFSKWRLRKTWLEKRLKRPVSKHLSTVNMLNVPKHCWRLQ